MLALALGSSSDVQHVQKTTRSASGAIWKEADGLRSIANPSALALGSSFDVQHVRKTACSGMSMLLQP